MNWRFQKLNYDILIPKLDKSIYQLSDEEAAIYFEWFIEKIPERVAYISKVCAQELGVSEEKMDLSPESLMLLWKWFRRRSKTEPIPRTDSENAEKKNLNINRANKRQLTLETEYILRDVGMYLGETFRKNYSNIYWTFYTKPSRDFFVNHPLLKGFVDMTTGKAFEACFEPIHMVHVQATRIINNTSRDTDLLKLYNIWSEKT